MNDDDKRREPDDAEMPQGDEPTEEDFAPADDDVDVSSQMQSKVNRPEQAMWHAPRGPGTRFAAVAILIFLAACLVGLTVLAIVTALS